MISQNALRAVVGAGLVVLVVVTVAMGWEGFAVRDIWRTGEVLEAIIRTPEGEEFTVREGDVLPNNHGEIAKIEEQCVVIKQVPSETNVVNYLRIGFQRSMGPDMWE